MVLRIGTEWCQHHGGVSCSFLLTLLTYCAISWASVTRNKKKYLCATYTRTPEQYIHLCTWNWWIGPQRSLWNEGSGGRSSSGPPQPSGRSEGWNRWVGVDQLLVLQLERPIVFFFVERMAVTGGGKGKGRKQTKIWRKAFPDVCPGILAKEPPTNLWDPPTQGFHYQAMIHPKPQVLSTHLPHSAATLFLYFFFFPSTSFFVLFVLF